jgi:hypothetical protein
MARLLRLTNPGAVSHVTSHGHARQRLNADDADGWTFLAAEPVGIEGACRPWASQEEQRVLCRIVMVEITL